MVGGRFYAVGYPVPITEGKSRSCWHPSFPSERATYAIESASNGEAGPGHLNLLRSRMYDEKEVCMAWLVHTHPS